MGTSAPGLDMSNQHPTEAMLGYTTMLEMDLGDGQYQDVGEVTDLTPWDASRDTVEVTNHRSPGFSVENIPGLIDWGSASFTLNAIPRYLADPTHPQGSLLAQFRTAGNTPWRITFPDGAQVNFLASLTSFSLSAPVKDVISGDFELAISGGVEFVQGATGAAALGNGNGSEEVRETQQAQAAQVQHRGRRGEEGQR